MIGNHTIAKAHELGQSIWLDFLSREFISSDRLAEMAEEQGLRGVTTNPKILASAISGGKEYEETIYRLSADGKSPIEIYEHLAVEDVRRAADVLHPYYGKGLEQDGFVSLEVNPHLAHDTVGTIDEARRLARAVDRPNVFIKVPATQEGLHAIRALTREGININVTLLFGLDRYREVAEAYLSGLEDRISDGRPVNLIYSVASFFLSRIDVLVDKKLDRIAEENPGKAEQAKRLRGEVAIASAKIAYQIFLDVFESERYRNLARKGAHKQFLLWGSTSTKDPAYSDVKYVDSLIGPDTVNTLPEETFEAFLDHGSPEARLTQDIAEARDTLKELAEIGIDLDAVTEQLVREGVDKFAEPFDEMLHTLQQQMQEA